VLTVRSVSDPSPSTTAVDASLARLCTRWATYWPSADVQAIAGDVRARLGEPVAVWRLARPSPLAGGEVALVCTAERDGVAVVLKVNPRCTPDDAELAAEGDALAFWAPTGAVPRVHARRDGGFTVLMERLRPGRALDATGVAWDDRLVVLGRLAARLHGAGAPPETFVPIGEYARYWRRALAAEPALLAELDALLVPADSDVLVHADLHGGNALRHGDGWKAIDPHGARGDRHADVWALLDPLAPRLPASRAAASRTARRWVARYADAAALEPGRARSWARLRARAEALIIDAQDDAASDDRAWAARLHGMADALA
jgi:streptomycin 6-kinase